MRDLLAGSPRSIPTPVPRSALSWNGPAAPDRTSRSTRPQRSERGCTRLGLAPDALVRVLALETGPAVSHPTDPIPSRGRVGVGPAATVPDLPASWAAARTALRTPSTCWAGRPATRADGSSSLSGDCTGTSERYRLVT